MCSARRNSSLPATAAIMPDLRAASALGRGASLWTRAAVSLLILLLGVGPLGLQQASAKPRKRPGGNNVGLLTIASLTRGAAVFVDDQEAGVVPLDGPLELSPGVSHVVRLQKRGYSTFVETIKLSAGEDREIEADLVPSGGVLKVQCNVRRAPFCSTASRLA